MAESTYDWAVNNIAGCYTSIAEASAKLREAAKNCHLIGGAAITPAIEGHEIQVTVIPINRADCYPVRGKDGDPVKKGIPKVTLMQIANAAGVEWQDPIRTDDAQDPYYCEFKIHGRYQQIDGTFRPIEGFRDVDLRDGSPQIAGRKDGDIAGQRANMVRAAITKAKLRALRDAFGVSQGMLESELDKPFVFARAIFTGRSDDPQVRQMFAQVIALKQLASCAAMFGGQMPTLTLPAPTGEVRQLRAARAVEVTEDGEVIEHRVVPAAPPPPPPPRPAPAQAQSWGNGGGNGNGGPPVWPWEPKKGGDPAKGTALTLIETPELLKLADYYDKNPGKDQWVAKNAALAKAARDIVAARNATPAGQTQAQAPAAPAAPQGRQPGDENDGDF